MRGVITGKDALMHLHLIAYEFGFACAFRVLGAVWSGRKTTFLEVVFDAPAPVAYRADDPALLCRPGDRLVRDDA